MKLRSRRARTAGAVAAVVAAGTTVGLALTAGNASADEPGRCTETVNVREAPDVTSRIVALCESGTPVSLGEERDGFVQLDDLGGWASRDFVSGTARAAAGDAADPDAAGTGRDTGGDAATRRDTAAGDGAATGRETAARGDDAAGDEAPRDEAPGDTAGGRETGTGGVEAVGARVGRVAGVPALPR
ncbi:MAG TPA: SH3 domain-containing protein [Pseudonocardia sp.]